MWLRCGFSIRVCPLFLPGRVVLIRNGEVDPLPTDSDTLPSTPMRATNAAWVPICIIIQSSCHTGQPTTAGHWPLVSVRCHNMVSCLVTSSHVRARDGASCQTRQPHYSLGQPPLPAAPLARDTGVWIYCRRWSDGPIYDSSSADAASAFIHPWHPLTLAAATATHDVGRGRGRRQPA